MGEVTGWEKEMGTNKCLVKQLLCLYPFPHVSQRSSGRLLLRPPSLLRGCPSLALRMRAFCRSASPSSADMSFNSSSMALSCMSAFVSAPTNLWVGRLAGGDGRASHQRGSRGTVPRHGVAAGGNGNRERHRLVAGLLERGGYDCGIGAGVGHALPAGDAVGIGGADENGVRAAAGVGLSTGVQEPEAELDDSEKRCVSGLVDCWSSYSDGREGVSDGSSQD